MDVLIGLIFTAILLIIAFFVGNRNEKKHYASILEREEALHNIMVVPLKRPPENFVTQDLVRGSVVISSNYFTRMLASFRNFFGGNIRSYETLLDRARREAILRMKAEAEAIGADIVFNMKFDTVSLDNIHACQQGGTVGTVEVLAYGTAGKMKR